MAKKDPPLTKYQRTTLRNYKSRVGRPVTDITLRDGRVALRIHGSGARQDVNLLIRRTGEVEPDVERHASRALDGYFTRRRREAMKAVSA